MYRKRFSIDLNRNYRYEKVKVKHLNQFILFCFKIMMNLSPQIKNLIFWLWCVFIWLYFTHLHWPLIPNSETLIRISGFLLAFYLLWRNKYYIEKYHTLLSMDLRKIGISTLPAYLPIIYILYTYTYRNKLENRLANERANLIIYVLYNILSFTYKSFENKSKFLQNIKLIVWKLQILLNKAINSIFNIHIIYILTIL